MTGLERTAIVPVGYDLADAGEPVAAFDDPVDKVAVGCDPGDGVSSDPVAKVSVGCDPCGRPHDRPPALRSAVRPVILPRSMIETATDVKEQP